jgi:hypothetical protein
MGPFICALSLRELFDKERLMDKTVRHHILKLQSLSVRLTCELIHATDEKSRVTIEGQLRAANAALDHFRAAVDILLILDQQRQRAANH